jgi:hypothetical protein
VLAPALGELFCGSIEPVADPPTPIIVNANAPSNHACFIVLIPLPEDDEIPDVDCSAT